LNHVSGSTINPQWPMVFPLSSGIADIAGLANGSARSRLTQSGHGNRLVLADHAEGRGEADAKLGLALGVEADDANVEHAFAELQLHRSEQRFAISL
jgi:hypothetical protein